MHKEFSKRNSKSQSKAKQQEQQKSSWKMGKRQENTFHQRVYAGGKHMKRCTTSLATVFVSHCNCCSVTK